jgi:hypothetical protein
VLVRGQESISSVLGKRVKEEGRPNFETRAKTSKLHIFIHEKESSFDEESGVSYV